MVQDKRAENAALAKMLGIAPADLEPEPKNALRRIVPRCENCRKWLLEDMRARCTACNTIVCRNDKRCHQAHGRRHMQEEYNRRAVAMSKKGQKGVTTISKEDFDKLMAAQDTTHVSDEEAARLAELMPKDIAALEAEIEGVSRVSVELVEEG